MSATPEDGRRAGNPFNHDADELCAFAAWLSQPTWELVSATSTCRTLLVRNVETDEVTGAWSLDDGFWTPAP